MTQPLPDPEALAIGYLAELPAALEVLGVAEDGKANVSSEEPGGPFPACRVFATPAGSDRELRWLLEPELQVELWDDPDANAQLGPTELRRRLYVLLQALAALPERDHVNDPELAEAPVVTSVVSSVPATRLDDPNTGQPRILAAVRLVCHPAVLI